ncbi:MAG TPA: tetratricopeptide repeat protein [Candidatus Limnocylindrales bacterium]|nr:tetratricopeptide repeat protein [Candidatus Limnocylindrales bacterium]
MEKVIKHQPVTILPSLNPGKEKMKDPDISATCLQQMIKDYEEALEVYTMDHFPVQYATLQHNLGNAYRKLAEIENRNENLKRALEAYEEALKVFTKEKFPTVHDLVKAIQLQAEQEVRISTQTSD